MTEQRLREVLSALRVILGAWPPVRHSDIERGQHFDTAFGRPDYGPTWSHLRWMIEECETFIQEGRREKVMRWLGFIQGTLWATGKVTIEQCKRMNAPADANV